MAWGYYAFVLGDDGHVVNRIEIRCGDDEEAIRCAKRLVERNAIEFWQEKRKVTRYSQMHKVTSYSQMHKETSTASAREQ